LQFFPFITLFFLSILAQIISADPVLTNWFEAKGATTRAGALK